MHGWRGCETSYFMNTVKCFRWPNACFASSKDRGKVSKSKLCVLPLTSSPNICFQASIASSWASIEVHNALIKGGVANKWRRNGPPCMKYLLSSRFFCVPRMIGEEMRLTHSSFSIPRYRFWNMSWLPEPVILAGARWTETSWRFVRTTSWYAVGSGCKVLRFFQVSSTKAEVKVLPYDFTNRNRKSGGTKW